MRASPKRVPASRREPVATAGAQPAVREGAARLNAPALAPADAAAAGMADTSTAAVVAPPIPTPIPTAATSPWPDGAQRAHQREAKRQAVLAAAAHLFNERGFAATSLDDIAARLHVSKPTLYYYVKSKDEILLACVRQGLDMTLQGIEASRAAGGHALDQLRACMQAYARIVMQPFGMCLIRVGDEQLPAASRAELRRMKSAIDQAFRRLVAQGIEEGVIAPCDPKMGAFIIAGALSWMGRWYQPQGQYSADAVIAHSTQLLLSGMLPRPGAQGVPQANAAALGQP